MSVNSEELAVPVPTSRRQLSDEVRTAILHRLLQFAVDWHLCYGTQALVAEEFHVHPSTVTRLWKRACETRLANGHADVAAHTSLRGMRPVYALEGIDQSIRSLPLSRRSTQRDIALGLGVPRSTVNRIIASGDHMVHVQTHVKPTLTEENRLSRVLFCLSQRGEHGLLYKDMFDRIHIDEKWFNVLRDRRGFYLAHGEPKPLRHTSHKKHIPKIMFMCAVARPRYDEASDSWWDGKIGMWPFAEQRPALKNSRNRPAGTLEWKSTKVNMAVSRAMMIDNVLPAIAEKWPRGDDDVVPPLFLQMDNAPAHCSTNDPAIAAACTALNLTLTLYCQPPNSPDLNVLDLGVFNAIQSIKEKTFCKNLNDVVRTTLDAFENGITRMQLTNIFLTLQTTMNCIIERDGCNDYDIVHMNKARLERLGLLPVSVRVTDVARGWNSSEDGGAADTWVEEDEEETKEDEEEEDGII
jgi:hypothetical protein